MSNICPYPGLRPFTEEESIYFKGRDMHIEQIISQLEEKKFLMLTGASGDGKSSLVYAGVIPNARAGFFKAKFNNWVVADFRPERNSLQQLSKSIAKHFQLEEEKTQKELSYGFSSLINLYKSSEYYLDVANEKYINADDKEKKSLKRKAANLLILADQFEEFFTNPENYSKGVPSKESQIVVNLLIETAKLALEQNIPIYIICTMRSDYIGQCAAFRGLPEMIGFSQFFVPRLKRKEIHQVIEAPALLSGNKISNRLIETLINEMSEGFDQLPVMQHTLNALWNIADKGNAEMDLIHLAMLGGISPSYLPKENKELFTEWFNKLSEFKKEYFKNYSLEQVLSAHADNLYETAFEYYNQRVTDSRQYTSEDSKAIIKTAFQCLTKIDEGRAVRNRMTLQEITEIICNEKFSVKTIGSILNIFREQGNTFISPFITDKPETQNLKPESVLDITHESLIRNWTRLNDWAKEEYENYQTFLDFNKQLQRWLNNNKSSGYLLPIGPLTYFENWVNTAKPNKYWFARYDETELSKDNKLIKAEQLLLDAELFIKRSARKLFFSRTVLKYGASKITAIIGIVALIISCTYYYFDYLQKQNPQVIERIENRGIELLKSKKVDENNKAVFIINYERLHPHSFEKLLNNINNDATAFDIALNAFIKVDNFADADSTNLNPLAYPLLSYMSGRLDNILNQILATKKPVDDKNLERLNKYVRTCVKIKTVYHKDTIASNQIDKYVWVLNNIVNSRVDGTIDSLQFSSYHLNQSIQLLTLLGKDNKLISIDSLLVKISPFENEKAKKRFAKMFPKDLLSKSDIYSTNLRYNGGYQLLFFLYANSGDPDKMLSALDSLKSKHYSNLNDVFISLKLNNRLSEELFLKIYEKSKKDFWEGYKSPYAVCKLLLNYSYLQKINTKEINIQNYDAQKINLYTGISSIAPLLLSNNDMNDIIDLCWKFESQVTKRPENLLFREAIYYKVKGMYNGDVARNGILANKYFSLLSDKIDEFKRHPNHDSVTYKYYEVINFYGTSGAGNAIDFAYAPFQVFIQNLTNPTKILIGNYSKSLETFIVKKLNQDINSTVGNLSELLYNYRTIKDYAKSEYGIFEFAQLLNRNNSKGIEIVDKEFLDLVFINKAFEENDTTKAYNILERIDMKKVLLPTFSEDKTNRYLIQRLAVNLAINGKYEESLKIINAMEGKFKRNILIDVVEALHEKGPVENVPLYLDLFFKSSRELQKEPDSHYGMKIYKDIAMVGTKEMYYIAERNLRDVVSLIKSRGQENFIRGIIYNNNYYIATQYIPDDVSSSKELKFYNEIISHYIHSKVGFTLEDMNSHVIKPIVDGKGWEDWDKDFQKSYGGDYENISGDDFTFDSLD